MIRKESLSDLQSIEITRTRETIGLFCPTLCLFTVAGHLNVEKMNVEKIKFFKKKITEPVTIVRKEILFLDAIAIKIHS